MHTNKKFNRTIFQGITLALIAGVFVSGPAAAAKKEPPQTTTDELTLTKQTKSRLVYTADDIDLSQYNKVMIVECAVAFKKNWQRDYNRNVVAWTGASATRTLRALEKNCQPRSRKSSLKR